MKKRNITMSTFKLCVYLMLGLSGPILTAQERQMPPAQVSVVEAEIRLLAPTMQVAGSVVSLNDAEIATQISGELEWIARVGTAVKKGDVVARIIPTLLSIEVQSAEAQLAKYRADLTFREQEVNRFKALANKDNTSKARLQEELSKRNMLVQDISSAKATLQMAVFYLGHTKIRSPFDGIVVNRLSNKGEFLSMGDKVVRLVDTYSKDITLNVPMSLMPLLSEGLSVQVLNGSNIANLPIHTIVPVGDKISRMVEVRVNASTVPWIIGTAVTVSLPKAEALTRISFPRDALIIKGSDLYVFRINADMKAERIDAIIEAIDGSWVAIKGNIASGDKMVIRGGERLQPDQLVSFLKL